MDAIFPYGGSAIRVVPLQPFGVYPWQAYVQPGDSHWSTPGMHRVAAPSATWSRGEPSTTQLAVPQPSHLYGGTYSHGGSAESHLIPPSSIHDGKESSFPGLVPTDDMVNSEPVVSIKPFNSGVVIGYWVDEFTNTCSAVICCPLPHLSLVHW